MPAVAEGVGLPWDVPVDDPVAALAAARAAHGDTFVVDSGPDRYLFTFSPVGVGGFYALPEEQASKGVADWRMLRRKVPDEVFADRRTLPHELFGREDVSDLPRQRRPGARRHRRPSSATPGEVDVFDLTRRLGHRVGLASWGGPGSADGDRFDRLAVAVRRARRGRGLRAPRRHGRGRGVGPGRRAGRPGRGGRRSCRPRSTSCPASRTTTRCSPGSPPRGPTSPTPTGASGIAYDVVLVHFASMSNLFAALGWAFVDLIDPSRGRPPGWPPATGRWPSSARSSRPAWPSARSWPATCSRPVSLDVGDRTLEVGAGHDHRHPAAAHQHHLGARPRAVAARALEPSSPGRHLGPRRTRAGHRLRPRPPHVPGPAVLAGRHDRRADPPAGHLRARAGMDRAARARAGPDRRRRPRRRTLPGHYRRRPSATSPARPSARRSRRAAA